MARPPDFLEQWHRDAERDALQAKLDELTHRLDQVTKGGRPGPDWDAFAEIGKTMLEYEVPYPVVRVALNRLITRIETVRRQTVEARVRQMLSDILAAMKQKK